MPCNMEILGITMMRRVSGRYKGVRCAGMGRASRSIVNGTGYAVFDAHIQYLVWVATEGLLGTRTFPDV